MAEVRPALPRSMRILMTLRLTGWLTTYSDSSVVKPTPEKADWAWNDATSLESPVIFRATVPILTTIMENRTTNRNDTRAASKTLSLTVTPTLIYLIP